MKFWASLVLLGCLAASPLGAQQTTDPGSIQRSIASEGARLPAQWLCLQMVLHGKLCGLEGRGLYKRKRPTQC